MIVPVAAPVQEEVHEPLFEDLSARWEGALADLGVPGMALVVVEGDTILHLECLGERDPVSHAPVTPDTIFYIASATKPFVALGLLVLAEEGKVDLDAPVRRYLPRFELADPQASGAITVRDLLCHRTGLQAFPIVFLDAYTGEITEDRYYHFLKEIRPLGETSYSNVHFTLAGRVIEAVSGKSWRDYLAERVFAPLEMLRTTGYADWMYAQEDVAIPSVYDGRGIVPAPVRKTDATMHAAGGLGASIRDLARWIGLHLGRGRVAGKRLASEKGMDEMIALQSRSGADDAEGFGLGWQRGKYRGRLRLDHGGGYVGSASHVSFLPELGLGLAVLANSDAAGAALIEVVMTDVYDRLLVEEASGDRLADARERVQGMRARRESETPSGTNPAADPGGLSLAPEAYGGSYANEHWGTVHVEAAEAGLHARMGSLSIELFMRGKDEFAAFAYGSLEAAGRFEIENGRAVALQLELPEARTIRFAR